MWCSVLQCNVTCCNELQGVAASCSALWCFAMWYDSDTPWSWNQRAVCCSVLQCIVACRSGLKCVAVCCSVLQRPQWVRSQVHTLVGFAHFLLYGVATIIQLLNIIGLFCKRDLSKRGYSAKETCDCKERANHIVTCLDDKVNESSKYRELNESCHMHRGLTWLWTSFLLPFTGMTFLHAKLNEQCVALCCSVLHCVVVRCSALECDMTLTLPKHKHDARKQGQKRKRASERERLRACVCACVNECARACLYEWHSLITSTMRLNFT